MPAQGEFIFSVGLNESLGGEKTPYDAREKHLRQVNDLLHLCLLHGDFYRARRAWCILAAASGLSGSGKRSPDWKYLWDLGLELLQGENARHRIDYVQGMMFRKPGEVGSLSLTSLRLIVIWWTRRNSFSRRRCCK